MCIFDWQRMFFQKLTLAATFIPHVMTLSQRAEDFLQKSEREAYTPSNEEIRNSFMANNVPIFESLLQFQLDFGDYIFYAGLEPITFTLKRSRWVSNFQRDELH